MKSLKSKMLGKKIMLSLVAAGVMSVGVCGSAWATEIVNEIVNSGAYSDEVFKLTNEGYNYNIDADGSNIEITSKNIDINVTGNIAGNLIGADAWVGGIILGSADSKITVSANNSSSSVPDNKMTAGIVSIGSGSFVNINADELNITAKGQMAYGIHVQNNTETVEAPSGAASFKINANNIIIDSDNIGIGAFSNGQMEVNGNLVVNAKNALEVRGNSTVNINTDGKHTTKINGDIVFETPNTADDPHGSGKFINSYVTINFNGADSVWNGRSYQEYDGKVTTKINEDPYHGNLIGFKIAFNNGATWNASDDSCVNELKMNNGIVNIKAGKNIEIGSLIGSGATFNMDEKDGGSIKVDNFDNNNVTINNGDLNLCSDTTIKGTLALNNAFVNSVKNLTLASTATLKFGDLANYKEYPAITSAGTVTAEKGAKVAITKAEEGTYKIVEANKVVNNMTDDDIQYESGMMTGTWVNTDTEMNLTVKAADLAAIAITTEENKDFLQEAVEKANELAKSPETKGFADLLNASQQVLVAGDNSNAAKQVVRTALAGAMQSGEVGGATSTAVSIVNNVAGITGGHMSIATPAPAGGKGVGLMEKGSGASVWAQYVHGKDKADALPMNGGTTKYSNSYSGIVVGADFKQVNKFQSGVAFNYVDGDGSSVFNSAISGHTDFKAYGITYYGAIKNDTVNTMFDVSYNRSKADSEQQNIAGPISASQKTNTWSVGTTVEKAFTDGKNGAQIIPYVGARYMRIGTDDYANSIGIKTAVDDQNVFLIPVGIKFRQENKYKSGWTVTPKADLSYIWALGDTDNDLTVSAPGLDSTSRLGYTVMDKGSFLGTIGLEASKNNWTYGISYSYQKGDYQRSDKYFFDIKYTF